jgi:hypothetical protein
MIEDYTIETLEKTFKEHAKEALKKEMDLKEKYKEDYEKYYGDKQFFNMSEALYVMCVEIRDLKNQILDGTLKL